MYVCVYVCMYICITYVCIYICIYVRTYACMYVCSMYVSMYVSMYANVFMYVRMYVYIYILNIYLSMLHYLCNTTCYSYLHFIFYTLYTYVILFVCQSYLHYTSYTLYTYFLVSHIIKKVVTIHGHINVKLKRLFVSRCIRYKLTLYFFSPSVPRQFFTVRNAFTFSCGEPLCMSRQPLALCTCFCLLIVSGSRLFRHDTPYRGEKRPI